MRIAWLNFLLLGVLSGAVCAGGPQSLIDAAEQAVVSGADARGSLDRILDELALTRDEDAADDLIDAIESLGDADGTSPQSVKQYLRAKAPATLRKVFAGKFSWTLRSDALMAHRALAASDVDLDAAIALAMADTSPQKDFMRSRGELLQDWRDHRSPQRRAELDARVESGAKTNGALASARALDIAVSLDQLMDSARLGAANEVAVLLDAGLDVNAQTSAWMSPLAAAATGACASPATSVENNLAVMDLLFARGADPNGFDALGNPILMPAVQQCPIAIIKRLLDGGAAVNAVNQQDFTPLEMALVLGKIDIAELLVARGARRDAAKLNRIFAETPSEPRLKALLLRAASTGQ